MREFLFRGKRISDGQWVYGAFSEYDVEQSGQEMLTVRNPCIIDYGNELLWTEVDPETVGQYTGLTDRNGKKIFEGDILNGLMGTMVVFFGEIIGEGYGFQWKTVSGNPRNAESMTGFVDEYEVVGNIHDNSEFLEVKP